MRASSPPRRSRVARRVYLYEEPRTARTKRRGLLFCASRIAPTAASPTGARRAARRRRNADALSSFSFSALAAAPAAVPLEGRRLEGRSPTAASSLRAATMRSPAASAGALSEAGPTTTRPSSGCSSTNHRSMRPSSGSSLHPDAPRAAWTRPVPTRARARESAVWARTRRRERPRRPRHLARRTVTSAEWTRGRHLPANRDRRAFAERERRFARGAARCATRRGERSSLCAVDNRARVVPVPRERLPHHLREGPRRRECRTHVRFIDRCCFSPEENHRDSVTVVFGASSSSLDPWTS